LTRTEQKMVDALTAEMTKATKAEGFLTAKELAEKMSVSRRRMSQLLDALHSQGRLERQRVIREGYDGRRAPIVAFRITASRKGK
jgi:predicted ArsR family transcriptional regulator